jgi:purine-binding chemotaxis protein CheW
MISSARSTTRASEVISFCVGQQEFCVDIMSVREIRGWTPAMPMPQAPSYLLGVIDLRGAVLPILDLSERLGLGASNPNKNNVIIVVQIGTLVAGLLVDGMRDILTLVPDTVQPVPDIGTDDVRRFVSGLLPMEGRLISVIELDQIIPRENAAIESMAA